MHNDMLGRIRRSLVSRKPESWKEKSRWYFTHATMITWALNVLGTV